MRRSTGFLVVTVCLLGGTIHEAGAQCPTVSTVDPPVIGRTINPASTFFSFTGSGDLSDGERITLNTSGTPVVFEFDTNGSVPGGNIPVAIPAPPGNRDAARAAFIAAVNGAPASPATASSIYSFDFPEYMTLVWKGESSGYGATNSDTAANISTSSFGHRGRAQSYVQLTGSDLLQVTAVNLNSTTSAHVIAANIMTKTNTELNLHVIVVPDGGNPATSAPPVGLYDIELISPCGSTVTILNGVEVVENLLNDGTFSMHFLGNTNQNGCGAFGSFNNYPSPVWESGNVPGMAAGSMPFRDKASLYIEDCQRYDPDVVEIAEPVPNFGDYIWGSLSSDQAGRHEFRQTIPVNYAAPTTVTLSGVYGGGTSAPINYGIELRDQTDTVIFEEGPGSSSTWIAPSAGNSFWNEFAVTGEFPPGTTEIQVVVYLEILNNFVGAAFHVDDLLLFEGTICSNPPDVTSITPGYGLRNDSSVNVTVDGSNFVDGDTTVKLFKGSSELLPVSMSVSSNQINATFDLTGAERDYWSVSVENSGCAPATLTNAFIVALAGPGLTNGSFELPEDLSQLECNYGTITPDGPTDWTSIHITPHGGGGHNRKNLFYSASPTCPPPDGIFWASTEGPQTSDGGKRLLTQTVEVTPGSYTLSGFLAAYGPNNVSLHLRDGGYLDGTVATSSIFTSGDSDWTFGYVSGDIAGNLLTAEWETDLDATGVKVAHADDFILEECTAPVTVTSINPTTGPSGDVFTGVSITGSGFGGGIPLVALVRPGTTVFATNVNVANDSTLTCDFDLTGAGFGALDVIVGNNGCYATLDDGFFTAPGDLLNGEFEEPVVLVPDPMNPGEFIPDPPCDGALLGEPDIWTVSDPTKFRRDDTVLADALTCPNPNAAGGHYGSLSTDQAEAIQVYQVIKVDPGRPYGVSGWFAGGGNATVTLRLVDGADPGGTEINSALVMSTSGAEQIDWQQGTVEGTPTQEFMTVIWELAGGGTAASSHADGLVLIPPPPCSDPFADADEDGDVDQVDFSLFQLCISGNGNPYPTGTGFEFCQCADREGPSGPDGDVDQGDFTFFDACYSGPDVPADANCD